MSMFSAILLCIAIILTMFSIIALLAIGDIFVYLKNQMFCITIFGYIFIVVLYSIGRKIGDS